MDKIRRISWISGKVKLKNSKISGKGMFAILDISEGEKVVIWGGNYIDRLPTLQERKNKLVMQWDDNLYSVDDPGDDDSYFINHSCDSNLWMTDAFTLVARRNIESEEELTADYALWEANNQYISAWNCNCGSDLCRGKVTGLDWKNQDIQQRYKNHFSPLINKRIENNLLI